MSKALINQLSISQERCTNMPAVPAMLQAMVARPSLKKADLSSLISVQMGATFILPEHVRLAGEMLKCDRVTNSFAATEGVPITIITHSAQNIANDVSVGKICMGARIRICLPNTTDPVPRGESGEIHIGGKQVIQRYLEGRSAESFYTDSHGHWFLTGDQGYMNEDGELFISGRYKDLIIRGGENIAPASIEAVLQTKLNLNVSTAESDRGTMVNEIATDAGSWCKGPDRRRGACGCHTAERRARHPENQHNHGSRRIRPWAYLCSRFDLHTGGSWT